MIEGNAGKDDILTVDVKDGDYIVQITHQDM